MVKFDPLLRLPTSEELPDCDDTPVDNEIQNLIPIRSGNALNKPNSNLIRSGNALSKPNSSLIRRDNALNKNGNRFSRNRGKRSLNYHL